MTPTEAKKVGGSDVASVLGLSRYGGPLSVYLRVAEGVEKDDKPEMARGRDLESAVLRWYGANHAIGGLQTSIDVRGLREHERASIDAVGLLPDDRFQVVEAKTAGWRVMGDWGEPGTDDIPGEYVLQVQWYLGSLRQDPRGRDCTDDVAHVPALVGGEFGLWVVRYDAELYQGLREGVARFWRDHVVPRRPPGPTALSNDADAIRKRYAKPSRPVLRWENLADDQRDTVRAWQTQKRCRELEESEEEEFAQRVRLLLGDHEGLIGLPDGSRVDWKKSKDSSKTDWEGVAREMRGSPYWDDDTGVFTSLQVKHTTTKDGSRPLCWVPKKKEKKP